MPQLSVSANRAGYLPDALATFAPPSELSLAEGQWLSQVRVVLRKLAAIGGTVTDERGDPVVGVMVRAYARVNVGGQDHLAAAATTTTDDRGQYRLFNLQPGRYVIAVPSVQASVPASTSDARLSGMADAQIAALEAAGQAVGTPTLRIDDGTRLVPGPYPTSPAPTGTAMLAYPMVFHPAATLLADATPVALQFGDVRPDVNVTLAPVGTASVRGRVQGGPASRGPLTVRLVASGLEGMGQGSETATALLDANGSFHFASVPFGSYVLTAGAVLGQYEFGSGSGANIGRSRFPVTGMSSMMVTSVPDYPGLHYSQSSMGSTQLFSDRVALTVGPSGVHDALLTLREGVSLAGTVRIELDPSSAAPSPLPFISVAVEPADGGTLATRRVAQVNSDDQSRSFQFSNLAPARYFIRSDGNAWRVKSVTAGGQEYRDTPLEATDSLSNIVITLTNQSATVTGSLLDERGAPASGVMVGVFPVDRSSWSNFGQSSPRMRATITADSGRYRIGSLPAGDYFVVVVPEARRNDWRTPAFFETAAGSAARVSLDWGQTRDQALRAEGR
jgi:protocatechuate 3,4-dioxygenase beta subunit